MKNTIKLGLLLTAALFATTTIKTSQNSSNEIHIDVAKILAKKRQYINGQMVLNGISKAKDNRFANVVNDPAIKALNARLFRLGCCQKEDPNCAYKAGQSGGLACSYEPYSGNPVDKTKKGGGVMITCPSCIEDQPDLNGKKADMSTHFPPSTKVFLAADQLVGQIFLIKGKLTIVSPPPTMSLPQK